MTPLPGAGEHVPWWFGRQRSGVHPGLERVRAVLGGMGDPQRAFRVVLVGGTNGKGTTAAALAACLRGPRGPVGLFTSPHLERVGERFALDGLEAGRGELESVLAELRPVAERHGATFFEIATAAAALLFARAGATTAVFEVGLGGRWDATNALDPVLSIVTGVALDHVDLLGHDVAGIARDKAGILRPRVPALTGAQGVAGEVVAARAAELAAPLWRVGREILVEGRDLGWSGQDLRIRTPLGGVRARTRLVGEHQRRNLALSVAAALRLAVDPSRIVAALPEVRWPGRLERFERDGRAVVLDGAHNPDAAVALAAATAGLGATPYTLVVGIGADKDIDGILEHLTRHAADVIATRARHSPRAANPEDLASRAGRTGTVVADAPASALHEALARTPPGGTVLVAGSLYLVGEMRTILTGATPERWERLQ